MHKLLMTEIICSNQFKDNNPRVVTTVIDFKSMDDADTAFDNIVASKVTLPNIDINYSRSVIKLY